MPMKKVDKIVEVNKAGVGGGLRFEVGVSAWVFVGWF